jgi:hypothetical protein
MAYSQWADFVNYRVGDIAVYGTTNYEALQANTNVIPSSLAPNWQVLPAPVGAGVSSLVGGTGALTMSIPTGGTVALVGNDVALSIAYPTNTVYQATYYKTTAQNLTSGNTDITFDGVGSWNNDGGYITHTSGTTAFTVVQTGLYQLEFYVVVLLNNGTWTTTNNKTCNIDITRPTIPEVGVLTNTSLQGIQNYGQSVSGSFYLVAGDVLNMRVGNIYAGGTPTPPQAECLQSTFDINTFFTWTYIAP